jgi:predicted nucleic acid-binding Zn ribbon protein
LEPNHFSPEPAERTVCSRRCDYLKKEKKRLNTGKFSVFLVFAELQLLNLKVTCARRIGDTKANQNNK